MIDIPTLVGEGRCYQCYGLSTAQAIKLALLRRNVLATYPSSDVSPAGLITRANCYSCYTQGNMFQLFELALLDILAGG